MDIIVVAGEPSMFLERTTKNEQQVVNKDNEKSQRRRKRRASEGSLIMTKVTGISSNEECGNHWKKRCTSLQQERNTVTERQLYGLMEESENREESLKVYIRNLESDLAQNNQVKKLADQQAKDILALQDEVRSSKLQMKDTSDEAEKEKEIFKKLQEENVVLLDQVAKQAALLEHYKFITATHFTAIEDGFVECCVSNPSKSSTTKFQLTKTDDENIMKYTPLEGTTHLPTFLQEAIEFETKDCPQLIQHVIKSIFPAE